MIRRRKRPGNDLRAVPRRDPAEERPLLRCDEALDTPILRFSPTAWAKLLYLRDLGETEVGGFGISAADDLLYIEDVQLVRQVCTGASVAFDDQSVAEFFDRQVDQGRKPDRFGRIWVHSHPGNCPLPSVTDEETFARVFGRTEWAVMFIVAQGGQRYARLRFHVGPGGSLLLPVEVDYRRPFAASNQEAWREEYLANVQAEEWLPTVGRLEPIGAESDVPGFQDDLFDPWGDLPEGEVVSSVSQDPAGGFYDDDFRL
jgi:hypothetical protein